ncbi:hypothetical protein H920_02634 [Fukomys damarensis]|uniref:Uncharacterized protein n=1 Tax=Fukomys damarensis TaxID=885580 RepID=A0A091DV46_FUKDA|nr:hypothetical protein H920_02634 [Fukomys damarensis]
MVLRRRTPDPGRRQRRCSGVWETACKTAGCLHCSSLSEGVAMLYIYRSTTIPEQLEAGFPLRRLDWDPNTGAAERTPGCVLVHERRLYCPEQGFNRIGLAILQQQMDLLNEEVEGLWLHTRLDCDSRFQQLYSLSCRKPF